MMQLEALTLDPQDLAFLKKEIPATKLEPLTYLFYENQIPIVALLILEGEIQLSKKNKPLHILKNGELFGVRELLTNTPSESAALITKTTRLLYLDKSTLLNLIEGNNPIARYFSDLKNLYSSN